MPSRRLVVPLVALFAFGFGSTRLAFAAEGWDATFAPASVASQLPAGDLQIIVVAAGVPGTERDAAATALVASLRAGGRAALVLDGASVGEVGAIDDADVVGKCAKLPVSHVVVVRLVDGGTPQVLVSVYAKDGSMYGAFVARAGVELPAASGAAVVLSGSTTPGDGVAREAMTSVEGIEKSSSEDYAAAVRKYESEKVGYNDIIATNGVISVELRPRFYVGKYKLPLEGAHFYRAIGRQDLSDAYDSRNATRWALGIGGAVLALGGTLYMSAGLGENECEYGSPDYDACQDDADSSLHTHLAVGLGASLVGTLLMIGGMNYDPNPVDAATQRRLAGEHNDKMKQDLGIHDNDARAEKSHVGVHPYVLQGGGGLILAGTF